VNVLAIDPSLTRTGVAHPDGTTRVIVPPKGQDRGMARLAWIESVILALVDDADLVVIEGYSFGSKGAAVFNIAELGGVVRLALWRRRAPYVEIAPSVVKKLATGKGNAPKEMVLVEAVKRLGYTGSDNNESDALWLRQAALHHYQLPGRCELPKAHLEALRTVEWPELSTSENAVLA
jgi:crossover junction endodeoxyribonuclease RuvC